MWNGHREPGEVEERCPERLEQHGKGVKVMSTTIILDVKSS